jgi:integrator complex subunit 6
MTTTAKMGDFRERLLWSRAPVVGYGSNDAAGVSATTSPDGSSKWSVDDDALPMSFFNQRTGEFVDSVQTRVSSRLMVHFGNPFKDKRGDSIVPEAFLNQSPSFKRGRDDASSDDGPLTPPGSPPHDAFTYEGEDEALFAGKPIRRPRSPRHHGSTELSMDHGTLLTPDGKHSHEDNESLSAETPAEDTSALRKKAKVMSERATPKPDSQGTVQRPPPPPKPPQHKKPPPPPPRPPPRPPAPPAEKCPASGDTEFGVAKPPAPKSAPVQEPKRVESILSTDESANVTDQNEKKATDLQSPDSKPEVDLPPGWMCVWSKSQKRWYFFDTKTNKSVWQWPPLGGLQS